MVQVPQHPAHPQALPLLLQDLILLGQVQAVWQRGPSVVAHTAVQAAVQMHHMVTSSAEVGCHAVAMIAPGGNADLLARSSAPAAPQAKVAATVT